MHIEQIYTACLAQAAYYIESKGEAIIIDPIREVEPYLEMAEERGTIIKYVFETHFHADFVSGHIDLAAKTGAQIIFGPMADTQYNVHCAENKEEFKVGDITIMALHTPGHTPESTSYLLLDKDGKEHAVFTGDTLFVGDVGRPDLLDGKMSKEELAGMMYESLKILKGLPHDVIVYPAHGPGSSCGKNLGSETWSTIGEQKQTNYALQEMSKQDFINAITDGLSAPPPYFFNDAMINKSGYENIDKVLSNNMNPLSLSQLKEALNNNSLVLDTRPPNDFEKGFIPGSINIGLDGMFAIWVGSLIKIDVPLLIIAEKGREEEAISRLARVGFENVVGYLEGGIHTWESEQNQLDTVSSITPEEFEPISTTNHTALDVRKPGEFDESHVTGATHIPLIDLEKEMGKLNKNEKYYVYCRSGYRSMVASSILKANGIQDVVNIYDGITGIQKTGVKLSATELA